MPKVLFNYLQLVRAPAAFTAFSNILAAQLIASQGRPDWAELALLGLASMALYTSGMALNDCFDFEEDLRERPSRPLPSGRIALRSAWLLGWALLATGVVLAALVGRIQLLIAALLAGAIVAYDGWAKHGRLGPLVMGGCRYLNWLLGLSVAGLNAKTFALALPMFIYIVSLTTLSAEETLARNRTVVFTSGAGLLVGTATIAIFHYQGLYSHHWPLVLLAAAFVYLAWRLRETMQDFTAESIQAMMKILILGVIPLDALLAFSGAPWWGGVLVAGLLIPGWLLAQKMLVT